MPLQNQLNRLRMSSKIRVRKALEDSQLRQKLRHKLPSKSLIQIPENIKHHYPATLIKL